MLPVDPMVLLAFVPAALVLNVTPGSDMMFVMAQGLRRGARAGLMADLGIALGCLVHVTVAGLGLAVFLKAHPAAFEVIRWGGVAYLLWLAFKSFTAGEVGLGSGRAAQGGMGRVFREALVVNLLNPKVALFILAFLPQFVDLARPVLAQFLTLGLVLCATGLIVNGLVALFAARIGAQLARTPAAGAWLNRISGGIMALLALRLALLERS